MSKRLFFTVKRKIKNLDKDYIPGVSTPSPGASIILEKYPVRITQIGTYKYIGGKAGEEFQGKIKGYGKKTSLIQRGDLLESETLSYKVIWVDGIGIKYTVLTLEEVR